MNATGGPHKKGGLRVWARVQVEGDARLTLAALLTHS